MSARLQYVTVNGIPRGELEKWLPFAKLRDCLLQVSLRVESTSRGPVRSSTMIEREGADRDAPRASMASLSRAGAGAGAGAGVGLAAGAGYALAAHRQSLTTASAVRPQSASGASAAEVV